MESEVAVAVSAVTLAREPARIMPMRSASEYFRLPPVTVITDCLVGWWGAVSGVWGPGFGVWALAGWSGFPALSRMAFTGSDGSAL